MLHNTISCILRQNCLCRKLDLVSKSTINDITYTIFLLGMRKKGLRWNNSYGISDIRPIEYSHDAGCKRTHLLFLQIRKEDTSMKKNLNHEFLNASGKVPYHMTNDYLFRAVLQSNNKALKGLVCSLLYLAEQEVSSVEIANPVVLGESVKNKEFRLDINVTLNNSVLINLEMQIANSLNWRERSVMYLCRSFDQLNHGQDYREAKPVIHIGFLDYALFEEAPEFHATYKLINIKSYQPYSDSLTLHVVDLSHIELATEEDKQYHIHDWAMLFKADTWEEIKMIASENEYLEEAAETMFQMSAEELVRKRCRDREEYYQDLRSYERAVEESERKREQDRKEHEADVQRLIEESERKREQDKKEHEADLRNYERVLEESERKREQDKKEYETVLREQAEQIRKLSEEIERLKKH